MSVEKFVWSQVSSPIDHRCFYNLLHVSAVFFFCVCVSQSAAFRTWKKPPLSQVSLFKPPVVRVTISIIQITFLWLHTKNVLCALRRVRPAFNYFAIVNCIAPWGQPFDWQHYSVVDRVSHNFFTFTVHCLQSKCTTLAHLFLCGVMNFSHDVMFIFMRDIKR